jgi:hypothetical protein
MAASETLAIKIIYRNMKQSTVMIIGRRRATHVYGGHAFILQFFLRGR